MIHRAGLAGVIATLTIILLSGCGSGNSVSGTGTPSTTVTFTFIGGTPTEAAVQTSGGAFSTASINGGQLIVTLPNSTTPYAIAYVCPPLGNLTREFVIEATPQDGTAFTVSCFSASATGSATGSVDATAIPGTTKVAIVGNQGLGGTISSASGSFNVNMPNGTNDVAAVAEDSSGNVLAVKIIRNQTVPGTINGGNQIVLATTDEVSTQSLMINNVPAGYVTPPQVVVFFNTANGTHIILDESSATNYPALPAAATQAGDFYSYQSQTSDTATGASTIAVVLDTSTGGGSQRLTLPVPLSISGPAAAVFPTFTLNYTGFNGLAAVAQSGLISWTPTATTRNVIQVYATAAFQGGANTITIPNLTSLPGFMASAPSGTTIGWTAAVFGGTTQRFAFIAALPANGSISSVFNGGAYTQP